MRSSRLIAGILVLGALTLTSIAGAGDTPMTKKQWRRAANSLCREASQAEDEIQQEVFAGGQPDDQPSQSQITEYLAGVGPIFSQLVTDIDSLNEPKDLKKQVKRFVRTARRELRRVVDDPSIGLESNPFSGTSVQAEALGLKECL